MGVAKQVLYVEDDTIDQLAFKRILSKDPRIQYTLAKTLEELSTVLEHKPVDLIITDYYLHDGTAHEVLHLSGGIPCIVVSGTIKAEEKAIFKEKGAIYYLGKPLLPETFLPLIQELLFGCSLCSDKIYSASPPIVDVHLLRSIVAKGPESEIFLTEIILHDIPQLLKWLELELSASVWEDIKREIGRLLPKLQEAGFTELAESALILSQSDRLGTDPMPQEEDLKRFAANLTWVARAASHIFPHL